jgi:hypothetical protein
MNDIATIHKDMRAAFRKAVLEIAGLPEQAAWEAVEFSPTTGVPYMSEGMKKIFSEPRAIGRGGTIQHKMLMTLNLFYPAGNGTLEAETALGLVLKAIYPGSVLTYNGASGTVMKTEGKDLQTETDFVNQPIVATVIAYTPN